jgi:hypothetical protein
MGRRRCLSGLGDRCGDVGAGGLDRDRGLDAAAPIAGFPALPPGGAQPPGPTRPGRRGLAAAGLNDAGCGDHGPWSGRPRLGVPAAVFEVGWGVRAVGAGDAGSCQRCWSIPGPSSPEHTFPEDSRSSSHRRMHGGRRGGCLPGPLSLATTQARQGDRTDQPATFRPARTRRFAPGLMHPAGTFPAHTVTAAP